MNSEVNLKEVPCIAFIYEHTFFGKLVMFIIKIVHRVLFKNLKTRVSHVVNVLWGNSIYHSTAPVITTSNF